MKILAVIANDRQASRSAAVAREMIRGAEAAGHEVQLFDLNQLPLMGCQNCRICRKQNCSCVLEDGLEEYFEALPEADAVILASPNYNSQPAGQMITFMNRHYCLLDADKQPRLDHDVKLISVFAQGAPSEGGRYQANYDWFLGCFKTKRLLSTCSMVVGGSDDLSQGGEIMERAYRTGFTI